MFTVGNIIKTSWKEFTGRFVKWLLLLSPMIIADIVFSVAVYLVGNKFTEVATVIAIVYFVVSIVLYLVVQISCIESIDRILGGGQIDIWGSYKRSLQKIWSLLWVTILFALIVCAALLSGLVVGMVIEYIAALLPIPSNIPLILRNLGIVAGIVMAIIYGLRYGLCQIVVILGGKKGVDALRAAYQMVRGRLGKFFLLMIGPTLVYGIALAIINSLITWSDFTVENQFANSSPVIITAAIITIILQSLISALLIPIMAAIMVMIYKEFSATHTAPESSTELPEDTTEEEIAEEKIIAEEGEEVTQS